MMDSDNYVDRTRQRKKMYDNEKLTVKLDGTLSCKLFIIFL